MLRVEVNIVYHTFSRLSPPKLLNYYAYRLRRVESGKLKVKVPLRGDFKFAGQLCAVVPALRRRVSFYGARHDAVRVLAPRIYEGGATSPQTWWRGEYEFPTAEHQTELSCCVCCTFLRLFVKDMWVTGSPRLRHPPHKCGGQGRVPRSPAFHSTIYSKIIALSFNRREASP